MFQLTISANTPEELNAQLITYVASLQSGALVEATKHGAADEETKVEHQEPESTLPSGRRSSRRGSENKAGEDAAAEPASRRGRGTTKENPVNDNEEQAALREQLIEDLQILADDEKSHKAVADALARVGSKGVHEIPSSLLGDFNEDIAPLLEEASKTSVDFDEKEVRAKLVVDLKDLAEVIEAPENEGEDTDVTETLKAAWKDAGAPVRGSVTDDKKLDKIDAKHLQGFASVVDGLITKYFG